MVIDPEDRAKIKTHGLEMLFIGIGVFLGLIASSIVAYHLFITGQIKASPEYFIASHFASNSSSISEELASPITGISFDDIASSDSGDSGFSEVKFILHLENGDHENLTVQLVKASDFWIVYSAILNPSLPNRTFFVSTYQKIMYLLERIDFMDIEAAQGLMALIKGELADPYLVTFLDAKVNNAAGFHTRAEQQINEIKGNLKYSKLAIKQEKARLYMAQKNFRRAIEVLLEIEENYSAEFSDLTVEERQVQFSLRQKDQLSALLDIDSVLGSTRVLLATSYLSLQKFDQALSWAEKSLEHAKILQSDVLIRQSLFIKGSAFYELRKYIEAEEVFNTLLQDGSSANLRQQAWIYYYKAGIAAYSKRDDDALDYYEIAINLDPDNSSIRKKAITYLIDRNHTADLEIALAFALRGMSYEIEREFFKDIAIHIYDKLGIYDRKSHLN